MPELPEVETIRRSLMPHLVGRRVTAVQAREIKLRAGIESASWRRVEGQRLEQILRRGKYLIALFGDTAAVFHLGMSGRLTLALHDAPRAPHTHLVLRLESGRELHFVDPRRFGMAIVMDAAELGASPPLAKLGADPLGETAVVSLRGAAARTRVSIRDLLLDQTVLAGMGNIYANEALSRASISPFRPACKLGARRIGGLAAAIREVLLDALEAGGTTLTDGGYVDAIGEAGTFAVNLAVYGREGQTCARCGGTIRRVMLSGRSAYSCPTCQR